MTTRSTRKLKERFQGSDGLPQQAASGCRQKTEREREQERQKLFTEIHDIAQSVNKYESAYKTAKLLQQVGVIPDQAALYLIEHSLSMLADSLVTFSRLNNRLKEIGERLHILEKKHNIDINLVPQGKWPADMQAIASEWNNESLRIRLTLFRTYGEHELADLLARNPEAFDRQFHAYALLEHLKADW
jgi:hypothetical protein